MTPEEKLAMFMKATELQAQQGDPEAQEILEANREIRHTSVRIPADEEYLNEFHKKWNEACMRENELMRSMHYSAEFLRQQSRRMEEAVKRQEEESRRKRKSSSEAGDQSKDSRA